MLKVNNLVFTKDSYDKGFNVFIDVEVNNTNYTFSTYVDYFPHRNLYSFLINEIYKYNRIGGNYEKH